MSAINPDWRIDEYLEQRAFPELSQAPAEPAAAQQALWRLDDTLRAIDAAEKLLARGYTAQSDQMQLAVLAGRTPDEARAAAFRNFRRDYGAAVDAERLAA